MLQEHVNGDSLLCCKRSCWMDSTCCSGVKGQHDLKSLPAGDLDEILSHLAKIVASDFVRSKIKILLTDQRDF